MVGKVSKVFIGHFARNIVDQGHNIDIGYGK